MARSTGAGRSVDVEKLRHGLARSGCCCVVEMCFKPTEAGRRTCVLHGDAKTDCAQRSAAPEAAAAPTLSLAARLADRLTLTTAAGREVAAIVAT
eukprot:2216247-Prymnesium_polylepis.1